MSNQRYRIFIGVLGVVLSLQVSEAREQLVSRVILGSSQTTRGGCPNYQPTSLTDDSVRYPASGTYTCPNGQRGES